MTYISQLIVFALAVMAILFKSAQTGPDGKPLYWRGTIPKLTRTGVIVLSLITLSSTIAMFAAYKKSAAEDDAKTKQQKAEDTLNDVQQQNKALRDVLGEVHTQGKSLSEDQRKQFTAVLTEQKQTGERIASDIQGSADLLRGRVDNSIDLLHQGAYEVKRAANPIKDIQISFQITPPKVSINVAKYQSRLEQGIKNIDLDHLPRGIFPYRRVQYGQVLTLGISSDSQLFPNMQDDGDISMVLRHIGVSIEFYNPAAQLDRLRMGFGRLPDLRVSVLCDTLGLSKLESEMRRATLGYDLKESRIIVASYNALSDPNNWDSTENITAIPDLIKSQMVVRVRPATLSSDAKINEALRAVIGQFEVDNITLKLSGREFQFERKMFTRYQDFDDHYFFVTNFSSNERQSFQ